MTGYRVWVENSRGDDYYYFFKKAQQNKAKALAKKLKREGRLNDVTIGDARLTLKSRERPLSKTELKEFWEKTKRKGILKGAIRRKKTTNWISKETRLFK